MSAVHPESPIFKVLTVPIGLSGPPARLWAQEEQSIEVNGTTLHYVRQGEGEPVVLVHGSIADGRVWRFQVAALIDAGFQPITFTRRYFGTHPWQDEGKMFTEDIHADDLAAFVDALGLGPVHVVTWSAGGPVAMLAALKNPKLFRSMAHYEPSLTIAPATEGGKAEWAEVVGELISAFDSVVETVDSGDVDLGVEQFLDIVFEWPNFFNRVSPETQQVFLDSGRTIMIDMAAPVTEVTCDAMAAFNIPTLLMVGEDTGFRYFPFVVEEMARCMPNAVTVVIPGATHGGPMLAADAVNAEIVKFLREHPDKADS